MNALFKALQGSTNMCSRSSSRRTEAVRQLLNLWCDSGAPEAAELEPLTELLSYKGAGLRLHLLLQDTEKDGTEQQKQDIFVLSNSGEKMWKEALSQLSHSLSFSGFTVASKARKTEVWFHREVKIWRARDTKAARRRPFLPHFHCEIRLICMLTRVWFVLEIVLDRTA